MNKLEKSQLDFSNENGRFYGSQKWNFDVTVSIEDEFILKPI